MFVDDESRFDVAFSTVDGRIGCGVDHQLRRKLHDGALDCLWVMKIACSAIQKRRRGERTGLLQRTSELSVGTEHKRFHSKSSAAAMVEAMASFLPTRGCTPGGSGHSIAISGSLQRMLRSCSGA
jgi:hypothetical protein